MFGYAPRRYNAAPLTRPLSGYVPRRYNATPLTRRVNPPHALHAVCVSTPPIQHFRLAGAGSGPLQPELTLSTSAPFEACRRTLVSRLHWGRRSRVGDSLTWSERAPNSFPAWYYLPPPFSLHTTPRVLTTR